MPGKSRRRKGKYSIQSKKQGGAVRSNASVQPPAAAQARELTPVTNVPAPPRVVPAPKIRAPAPMVKSSAVRYANVPTELRTIGILAGIILVLLVVLARVLS